MLISNSPFGLETGAIKVFDKSQFKNSYEMFCLFSPNFPKKAKLNWNSGHSKTYEKIYQFAIAFRFQHFPFCPDNAEGCRPEALGRGLKDP